MTPTNKELRKRVSDLTGITNKEAGYAIVAVLQGLTEGLLEKGKMTLPNFGTFKIQHAAEKKSRNPRTGEPIIIPSKEVIRFKPALKLKEKLAQR